MNLDKPLLPGQVIGIIGGGHLAKMMALSAREMGFRVGVLDPQIDCPLCTSCRLAIIRSI